MRTEPGRVLDLLVAAFERQQANYAELQATVECLADFLLSRRERPADAQAGGEAGEFDRLTAAQMRALRKVEETEQQIAALRERLAGAMGIDQVTVSALRAVSTARGGAGIDRDRVDALARILRTVSASAERIREITDANEARIRAAMKSIRGQMDEVRLGQHAARAYGDIAKGLDQTSRFVDKRK